MVFQPRKSYGTAADIADPQSNPQANPQVAAESRVAEALARAADIDASDVSVTAVGDGIVLRGMVAFPEEVAIAGDIASRVAGVTAVENLISTASA